MVDWLPRKCWPTAWPCSSGDRAEGFYPSGREFESLQGRVCEILKEFKGRPPVEIYFGLLWAWNTRKERTTSWKEHILSGQDKIEQALWELGVPPENV